MWLNSDIALPRPNSYTRVTHKGRTLAKIVSHVTPEKSHAANLARRDCLLPVCMSRPPLPLHSHTGQQCWQGQCKTVPCHRAIVMSPAQNGRTSEGNNFPRRSAVLIYWQLKVLQHCAHIAGGPHVSHHRRDPHAG
uniref:Uncharacterized protein n=1 Tax=Aegilops tauschii subsp. strangulata TaxID=200361 RepID=A0A452ZK10_AEGTS